MNKQIYLAGKVPSIYIGKYVTLQHYVPLDLDDLSLRSREYAYEDDHRCIHVSATKFHVIPLYILSVLCIIN